MKSKYVKFRNGIYIFIRLQRCDPMKMKRMEPDKKNVLHLNIGVHRNTFYDHFIS